MGAHSTLEYVESENFLTPVFVFFENSNNKIGNVATMLFKTTRI